VKRIVILCCVLILQGLNSFGQTNAVPPTGQLVPRPEGQKAVSKPKTAGDSAVPTQGTLSRSTEAQPAELGAIRRISREGLLMPRGSKIDFGAMMERIFRSENDQMGETCIRDTVVTIFPTGR
jgi:hypothetical protein